MSRRNMRLTLVVVIVVALVVLALALVMTQPSVDANRRAYNDLQTQRASD